MAKNFPSAYSDVAQHTDLSTLTLASLMLGFPLDLIFGPTCKGNVMVTDDTMHPMTPDLDDAPIIPHNTSSPFLFSQTLGISSLLWNWVMYYFLLLLNFDLISPSSSLICKNLMCHFFFLILIFLCARPGGPCLVDGLAHSGPCRKGPDVPVPSPSTAHCTGHAWWTLSWAVDWRAVPYRNWPGTSQEFSLASNVISP